MNASFLSVDLELLSLQDFWLQSSFFLMVTLLTVSPMQAAQDLMHFLPEIPLFTYPKLTFTFFTIFFIHATAILLQGDL